MKESQEPRQLSFNEQRALHDLEELQRQIERLRGQRKDAEAEFDKFVQGFRPGERRPESIRPSIFERPPQPPEQPPASASTAIFETAGPVVMARRRDLRAPVGIAIAAVVVIATIAIFATRSKPNAPAPPSSATVPQDRPPQPSPTATPAPSAPAPSAVTPTTPQGGVNLEIVTHKPVWVRVTIDGRRAMERELPSGQRIPLHGERTILIRAGNAGGITVRRNGSAESSFGPEGVALTREFTVDRPRP